MKEAPVPVGCRPGDLLGLERAAAGWLVPVRVEQRTDGLVWVRVLAPPDEVERPVVGEEATLWQIRENDARYRFVARLDRAEPPPAGLLGFRPLGSWERVQERSAARLGDAPELEDVRLEITTPTGDRFLAHLLDLSARGARIWSELPLAPGAPLTVLLDLPNVGRLRLTAVVVRVLPQPGTAALRFAEVPLPIEDRIFAFVLRQQAVRRRLQRGG